LLECLTAAPAESEEQTEPSLTKTQPGDVDFARGDAR